MCLCDCVCVCLCVYVCVCACVSSYSLPAVFLLPVCLLVVDWGVAGNFAFGYWVAFVICLYHSLPVQLLSSVPLLSSSSF